MEIKVIIADDEELSRKRIHNLLSEHPEFSVVSECENGLQAIDRINTEKPNLVFMDVQMPDLNGFEVLKHIVLEEMPAIVFITAFDQYAMNAFDHFTLDYLLKPYKDQRFELTIKKLIKHFKGQSEISLEHKLKAFIDSMPPNGVQKSFLNKKIVLKLGINYTIVDIRDINYIIASGPYVEIFLKNGKKHLYRTSMSKILEEVNDRSFIRIHRSYIVNLDNVEEIVSSGMGELDIIMKDQKKFHISKSYKEKFFDALNINEID